MRLPPLSFCLPLFLACSIANADTPQIDGLFSDWQENDATQRDPTGDSTGAFDVTSLEARVVGAQVFLRLQLEEPLNLQSGAESDGTLVLNFTLPRERTLQVDFRGRIATLRTASSASIIPWAELRYVSLPTHAAKQFELRLDLTEFGVSENDNLALTLDGSDSLSSPLRFSANAEKPNYADLPSTKRVPGSVRIASMNTLRSGLADSERTEGFERMLQFAGADVYAFNEEWESEAFESGISKVLGSGFNRVWNNGCGIASKSSLKPLDLGLDRGCAALAEVDGKALVVVSVHFECCGFAGSDQDEKRIAEAKTVAKAIARLRGGDFGPKVMNAGFVVLGDYNLVGSREPLDLILGAGCSELLLRSPMDGCAATWRGTLRDESFWPGRLDCVVIGKGDFEKAAGYALHPAEFASVAGGDSVEGLSDHAMLVVDLQ